MRQGATPVPIPNTMVKTLPADDTRLLWPGKAGGCRNHFINSRGISAGDSGREL